jgi:three-Cys-motif partner protein
MSTGPSLLRPVWSENKAALVAKYLFYFAMVAKHGTYIDGFAGPQRAEGENRERLWTARLALESEPKWFRTFVLCDANRNQVERLRELAASPSVRPPGPLSRRRIEVVHGDFNEEVAAILERAKIGEKKAAFCLLDQRTFECEWRTVETLARWKQAGMKIELFYFVAAHWFGRAVKATRNEETLRRWWGGDGWRDLTAMNCHQRADLICDRFRRELGYTHVRQFPIYSGPRTKRVMYSMIHASDHPKALGLMARAYNRAVVPESASQVQLELQQFWGSAHIGGGAEPASAS